MVPSCDSDLVAFAPLTGAGLNSTACDGGTWGAATCSGCGPNGTEAEGDIACVGVVVSDVYAVWCVVEVGSDSIPSWMTFGSTGGVARTNVGRHGVHAVDYSAMVDSTVCDGVVAMSDGCESGPVHCYSETLFGRASMGVIP